MPAQAYALNLPDGDCNIDISSTFQSDSKHLKNITVSAHTSSSSLESVTKKIKALVDILDDNIILKCQGYGDNACQ